MRTKIYHPQNHCLSYVDREADERFWDEKWALSSQQTFASPPRHGLTVNITRRYLPVGSRILEGGCGLGDVVYALDKAGYVADGIDYAPKVVQAIKKHWPHLRVNQGDVRHLDYCEGYFDGYWSIGVIEHFSDGYDAIAREMQRVLRPGGYLFLSFPSFNPFRQSQAVAGKYAHVAANHGELPDFYQYALNPVEVQEKMESLGLEVVEHRGMSSLQTLSEDWPLAAYVQRLLDYISPRLCTGVSTAIDMLMGKYLGHSCLLIFRRKCL